MPDPSSFTELHQTLLERYNREELRTLCAQLGVDFEDLPGEGRQAKARELVLWMRRRGRLNELEAAIQETRQARPAEKPRAGGVPTDLYGRLREALLDCDPFVDDGQLRAVFAHAKLRPWRHSVPQAPNPAARVDAAIAFLAEKRRGDTQENALVLLLHVLSEQLDPADERHQRLAGLAQELSGGLPGGPGFQAPPAAGSSAATLRAEETASLQRQLAKLRRNLLTIEEQEADFIDPRSTPPDLIESGKRTREKIAEIEARLAELES